ncbi:schlafen family member 13-like [Melanerpes formicivorus]|uniref:schlafen family member 13-like n=1 Tax=Melanerpes formicivorus TaxID=211600 RepID=UPI00358FFE6C
MASQEGKLLVNLKTNYADVVVDIEKIGKSFKKKTKEKAGKKKEEKKSSVSRQKLLRELPIAVCALLNSGGGIVRMETEDNYSFKQHGVGEDIEDRFKFIDLTQFSEYFTWMQQRNHLLLFVKTWSCGGLEQETGTRKARICSLSTGLFLRSNTSVLALTSGQAAEFLRERCDRERDENGPQAKKGRGNFDGVARDTTWTIEEHNIQDAVGKFLEREELMSGEVLDFTETKHIEFKNFATESIFKRMKEALPKYISAFANTDGGYLIFGVDDNSTVVGCLPGVEKEALERTVASTVASMRVHHFCGSRAGVQFETHILRVCGQAESSYVCAVRVEPFCCAVFGGQPESWMVAGEEIEELSVERWMELMTAADPDLSGLAEKFENELSLANSPPLTRPVYSKAGLPCLAELQKKLYPVGSNKIKWMPETICTELFSEYPGLQDLMQNQISPLNKGVLVFSRSWAVEIGLQKTQDVVCDALLVAENEMPLLYTVVRDVSPAAREYSRGTARALKQKLVNDGGCAIKLCVIPQVLHLQDTEDQMEVEEAGGFPQQANQPQLHCHMYPECTNMYPEDYILTSRGIPALLRALVIVVLRFKSYLSDWFGCEIFNLLTVEQYELLSKNLDKTKNLFVFGLPGTGKTIVAMKIIERIRNIYQCHPREILYICENTPLKKFVGNEIPRSVTRVAFENNTCSEVKHIVVDEAQNFRPEENWYHKAQELVKQNNGIFWVFMDFFQLTHTSSCGLNLSELYPQEWLTKVVRNARQIYGVMLEHMEKILQERKNEDIMPYDVLENLFERAECAHPLPGSYTEEHMEPPEMLEYVIKQCYIYIQRGHPMKDIAVLCSTRDAAQKFREELENKLYRQNMKNRVKLVFTEADNVLDDAIVIDSIRRFSGLERRIVFGIHPVPAQEEISRNLLLCLVSRANTKLHVLYHKDLNIPE